MSLNAIADLQRYYRIFIYFLITNLRLKKKNIDQFLRYDNPHESYVGREIVGMLPYFMVIIMVINVVTLVF